MKTYNALSIAERLRLYTDLGFMAEDFSTYQKWINTRGLLTEEIAATMLDVCHMTREELNLALKPLSDSEILKVTSTVENTHWRLLYNQILQDFSENMESYDIREIEEKDVPMDMSYSVAPFIVWAEQRITMVTKKLQHYELTDAAKAKILENLGTSLVSLAIKTLVWELHCYKTDRTSTAEDGSDKLYRAFIFDRLFGIDKLSSFYNEYPVIARRITIKCEQITNHFVEMIQRLDDDYLEIHSSLLSGDFKTGLVTDITCSQGDMHQQGRSVILIHFNNAKIVYKPRNLDISYKFREFIEYLNEKPELMNLYSCKGIYKENYAFEEYIDDITCTTETQIENYYRRFGQLCAIVYMFAGSDIHYENIIAHSEYPVIVDIETLMQHLQIDTFDIPDDALRMAYSECLDSIVGTAMIPVILFGRKGDAASKGVDISALGGEEQLWPYKILVMADANTDKMRFELQEVKTKGAKNIPLLNDKAVDFNKYKNNILAGFENCLTFFMNNKMSFLEKNGILANFKEVQIRIILKATINYVRFMEFSSHPNYSKDMLDLERMLSNSWAYGYKDKRVITYEVNDMLEGDIPIFFCRADSHDLISSTGSIIESYLEKSPYERVINRFERLDRNEITKQKTHMVTSFGMYEDLCAEHVLKCSVKKNITGLTAFQSDPSSFLSEAIRIGDSILDDAIVDYKSNTIMWNNVLYADSSHGFWKVTPLDAGLANGLSGLLLYFLMLEAETGSTKYRETVNMIINMIDLFPIEAIPCDLSKGKAGILFALASAIKQVGHSDYLSNRIARYARALLNQIDDVEEVSLLDGSTGIASAMIDIYEVSKNDMYLDAASKCLERIVNFDFPKAQAVTDFGFGYGLLGHYAIIQKVLKHTENSSLRNLKEKMQIHITKELPSFIKNCSFGIKDGLCGLLLACPELVVGENKLTDLVNETLKRKNVDDSLITGVAGLILANSFDDQIALEIDSQRVTAHMQDMIKRSNHNNGFYAIKSLDGFPTVGLFDGISGIGVAMLLHYRNNHK
jgi:type 2 lantibiotic biosynthesis protein LanM